MQEEKLGRLEWISHASFLTATNGKNVYIDPFKIGNTSRKADVIFVTHPHFDHMDMQSIRGISTPDTVLVAPEKGIEQLGTRNVIRVKPFMDMEIAGIKFSTLPAYNTNPKRLANHPKQNGWVGYVIQTDNVSIYHAGDTDFIDEMKGLEVDIALLPIGGTYTMDIDEAIAAAHSMKAKTVVPMHYKALLGQEGAVHAEEKFAKEVKNSTIMKETQKPAFSF